MVCGFDSMNAFMVITAISTYYAMATVILLETPQVHTWLALLTEYSHMPWTGSE